MLFIRAWGALLGLLWAIASFASPDNTLVGSHSSADIRFEYVLRAPEAADSLNDILALSPSDWQPGDAKGANFGFTQSVVWLRFTLHNESAKGQVRLVEVGYPQLDHVTFFELRKGQLQQEYVTGDSYPFQQRLIDNPSFLYPVALESGESSELYLRVTTRGSLGFPLRQWGQTRFFEADGVAQRLHFYYYGLLSVTILLTAVFYVMLREPAYLFYAVATSGYLLFFACIRGFAFQVLWPDSPVWGNRSILVAMPVLGLFSVLFARSFLQTARQVPRLDICLRVMAGAEFLNLLGAIVAPYDFSVQLSALLALPLWLVLFLTGPIVWRQGSRQGVYYTFAWSLLTCGYVLTMLHKFGIIPNSLIAEYGMQIGSAVESILLTFALAERLYHEREAKIAAQSSLLDEARQRREAQQRLVMQALHDPQTGMPVRAVFEMRLRELSQHALDPEYFVCVVWFSGYKDVVMTLGQNHADTLMRQYIAACNEQLEKLPGTVLVERVETQNWWGASLEPGYWALALDADEVRTHRQAYERFLAWMASPQAILEFQLELGPVVGVCQIHAQQMVPGRDLRNATIALEIARTRNRPLGFYLEAQDYYTEQRLTLMSGLRNALKQNQTQLFYQPKVRAGDGKVVGLEALIRWSTAERGWIRPDEFIPLAERTDLIQELTQWVLRQALGDLAQLHREGYGVNLSVNLSARNLTMRGLEDFVNDLVAHYGLAPSDLTLELTETAVMHEPEAGIQVLSCFRNAGYTVAVDDFGSGYSSLSYLKRMPVSEIKIDKSLVTGITTSESANVILQTTITMCHALGFYVVAEGVETAEEVACLNEMACDLLQGYYIARPAPLAEIRQFLADSAALDDGINHLQAD
ncbi:MAG: EAL domain-containing protein [Hahellaceae bacterium]|nr:EAL domain-containing protein [Hahellaceae bacterium]